MSAQHSAFGKQVNSSIYGNPYILSKAERSPGEDSVSKLVATEGCITEECIIRLQVHLIQHCPSQRESARERERDKQSIVLICNTDCDYNICIVCSIME